MNVLKPLVPADCDLRDFHFMPLDVVRLRDSDLAALESPEACWAAVLLWAASWHQVPAGSLPSDDRILSRLAGYGRVVAEWAKVKAGALRGWITCSDGRLYHPVIAEKAREAWDSKLRQRWKTECSRLKKQAQRKKLPYTPLPYEEWLAVRYPSEDVVPRDRMDVPGDTPEVSPGQVPDVPDTESGISAPRDRERDRDILTTSYKYDYVSVPEPAGQVTPAASPARLSPVPSSLSPSAALQQLAAERGLELDNELGMFLAHMRSTGKLSLDWDAEFEKWLRRSRPAEAVRLPPSPKRLQQGQGAATGKPWFLTASGIEAKARELGFVPPPDAVMGVWKFDLYKLAGLSEQEFRSAEVDYA